MTHLPSAAARRDVSFATCSEAIKYFVQYYAYMYPQQIMSGQQFLFRWNGISENQQAIPFTLTKL